MSARGGLRATLLAWYGRARRDLPWRRTSDPYAIWVSEVMLQQTRVETVIPYYERFLARFPTVSALARAGESEVLASWSGLGYYGRARNLRRAADALVREHAGRLPEEPELLRALPGIGRYTAAAIASVAFGRPAAAVDGNVIRVLARIEGLRGRRDSGPLRRRVERIAEALAAGARPGDWTQALMELGATICLPREPLCAACPVARRCRAGASGAPDRYPEASPAKAPRPQRRLLLAVRHGPRLLVVPDPSEGGVSWTLPAATLRGAGAAAPASGRAGSSRRAPSRAAARAAETLARSLGVESPVEGPLARFRHRTYSHDIEFEVWGARATRAVPAPGAGMWARRADLERLPVRAPTLKAFLALKGGAARDKRRGK